MLEYSALLAKLLETVINTLVSSTTKSANDAILDKLRKGPEKKTFQKAISNAIRTYSVSGFRLRLAKPLLSGKVLESKEFTEAVSAILANKGMPNPEKLGAHWRAVSPAEYSQIDFTKEAASLLGHIQIELRNTDAFRPVFDSGNLEAISYSAKLSSTSIQSVEVQLRNLQELLDSKLGQLNEEMSRLNGEQAEGVTDFSAYVESKTKSFTGRKFVFDEINHFIAGPEPGYFLLQGDPGIGKSALMAQWVKQTGCAHHFNIRSEGVNTAEKFIMNITGQLAAIYGLGAVSRKKDSFKDGLFLRSILDRVSQKLEPDMKAVIAVDALDEVDSSFEPGAANPLFLPKQLPKGIVLVISARRGEFIRSEARIKTWELRQDSVQNLNDIKEYLEGHTAGEGIQEYLKKQSIESDAFVEQLLEKSQGNFMYLYYVLPEFERGAYSDIDLKELPVGLMNYYEEHWRRMKHDSDDWFNWQLPVLETLAATPKSISIDMIASFTNISQTSRIVAALEKWAQFLNVEMELGTRGVPQRRYRLYHASFSEFLRNKEQLAEFSKKRALEAISENLMTDLYGE